MNCQCNKEIVDIVGLCDHPLDAISPTDLATHNNWTEISIPETLIVPEQKPDIEQLVSVNISAEIIRQKVIPTPDSTGLVPDSGKADANEEGKKVTGRKLVVEGVLCQTVTYVADIPEQTVHSASFTVPFSAFIVLPGDTPLDATFLVNVCIEDVFIKGFCPRQIFKNVTLFLHAVPAAPVCPDDC